MDILMKQLDTIRQECLPEDEKQQKNKDEDPFNVQKEKVSSHIKKIRELIKERDEKEKENPGSTEVVKLASSVRRELASVQEEVVELKKIQTGYRNKYEKSKKRKKTAIPKFEEYLEKNDEVIDCIGQHIEECTRLEKRRAGISTAGYSALGGDGKVIDPTVTELPDVDDPRFLVLKENDQRIDEQIDVLGQGVKVLKNMSYDMKTLIQEQADKLDTLETEVDKADARLIDMNEKVVAAVKQARGGSKICVDIILIIVFLGLVGLIIKILKNRYF